MQIIKRDLDVPIPATLRFPRVPQSRDRVALCEEDDDPCHVRHREQPHHTVEELSQPSVLGNAHEEDADGDLGQVRDDHEEESRQLRVFESFDDLREGQVVFMASDAFVDGNDL